MTVFEKEKAIGDLMNAVLQTLNEWYTQYAPQTPDEPQDDRFLYALHTKDYAEYLSDQFRQADQAGRLAMQGDIRRIENEIRELAGNDGE